MTSTRNLNRHGSNSARLGTNRKGVNLSDFNSSPIDIDGSDGVPQRFDSASNQPNRNVYFKQGPVFHIPIGLEDSNNKQLSQKNTEFFRFSTESRYDPLQQTPSMIKFRGPDQLLGKDISVSTPDYSLSSSIDKRLLDEKTQSTLNCFNDKRPITQKMEIDGRKSSTNRPVSSSFLGGSMISLGNRPIDINYRVNIQNRYSIQDEQCGTTRRVIPEVGLIYCIIDYNGKGSTYVVLETNFSSIQGLVGTMVVAEAVAICDQMVYYDPKTITKHTLSAQGTWFTEESGVHWGCVYHSDGLIPENPSDSKTDVETFNYSTTPFPVRMGRLSETLPLTPLNRNLGTIPVLPANAFL